MNRIEKIAVCVVLASIATPAFAAVAYGPAPVAGIGVGAVLLIGAGYKAIKSRIGR
jgi:hypothetical protein